MLASQTRDRVVADVQQPGRGWKRADAKHLDVEKRASCLEGATPSWMLSHPCAGSAYVTSRMHKPHAAVPDVGDKGGSRHGRQGRVEAWETRAGLDGGFRRREAGMGVFETRQRSCCFLGSAPGRVLLFLARPPPPPPDDRVCAASRVCWMRMQDGELPRAM
eukprot:46313-Chlamydomonas_euryale.AAC.5